MRKLFLFPLMSKKDEKEFIKNKTEKRSKEEKLYFLSGNDLTTANLQKMISTKNLDQLIFSNVPPQQKEVLLKPLAKKFPNRNFVFEEDGTVVVSQKMTEVA